ncbi:MAG: alpha/beta hydrolase, partial [Candidatus Micrarchaeaceae archaeon]
IHRWYGNSECDWIPWLKRELNKKGVGAVSYNMPDTKRPKMDEWVQFISKVVDNPGKQTYFIGHSIGCQAVIRYISGLQNDVVVGGAVLVAPWVKVVNLESEEEPIARSWITTPIDWENSIGKRLNAKMVLDKEKGHFTEEEGVTELPSLLDESLAMCKD